MQACARKVHLSPSVSLPHYASLTAGYSGADLQALIYNAHLDAIHAALNAAEGIEDEKNGKGGGEEEVKYVSIGGNKDEKVLSRAEQANVNKRVSRRCFFCSLLPGAEGLTRHLSCTARAHPQRDEGVVPLGQGEEDCHFRRFAVLSRSCAFLSPSVTLLSPLVVSR